MSKFVVVFDQEVEANTFEFISDVLEFIKKWLVSDATIASPQWDDARINIGWDENGQWASPRYFPNCDSHGNDGIIPEDAQIIIQRICNQECV